MTHLTEVLAAQWHIEDTIGSSRVMPVILAEIELVENLTRQARGAVHLALVALLAEYHQRYIAAAPPAGTHGHRNPRPSKPALPEQPLGTSPLEPGPLPGGFGPFAPREVSVGWPAARKLTRQRFQIPAQHGLSGGMQETWATGDFHRLGVEQLIVGERLCEEVDVRAGDRVLDIACGAGNTALAAARRRARCTGCDFVPALLERAELRASAEGLAIEWVEADAHALPFDDGSFDKVLSTFGVMFAVDQQRAADELLRVLHPGGTLGLSCWTPASAIGDIFRLNARFIEPPPNLRPPTQWASGPRLRELFGDRVSSLRLTEHVWRTRFASFSDWLELYRTWYGPTNKTFAGLDEQQRTEYTAGLEEIVHRHNRATDGTILAAYEYVNIVGVRTR